MKVLVVDDENQIVQLLKRLLTKNGYEIHEANNGREGLDLASNIHFDAMITDIVMPELGGVELIRSVRATNPAMKIIAISGGALIGPATYLALAKQAGANYIFEKPFDPHDLLNALRE